MDPQKPRRQQEPQQAYPHADLARSRRLERAVAESNARFVEARAEWQLR